MNASLMGCPLTFLEVITPARSERVKPVGIIPVGRALSVGRIFCRLVLSRQLGELITRIKESCKQLNLNNKADILEID